MDVEEPAFKITSMPFVCNECKKHEAMITCLKRENEALRKENAELKAEKPLTSFSYDNIWPKKQIFKRLTGLSNNFVDPGEHREN